MSGWGKYQTAQEMEINRRFEYDPKFLPVLHKWIDATPGKTILDVGCGSGFFTRVVALGLHGKGKVIGIDPDESLLLEAEKIAKRTKFSKVIEFKVGNTYHLPLPNDYADVVTCHIVLCNIPRQFDAILEMKRVAKTGGTIAVIEPAKGGGFYLPDARLTELHNKFQIARNETINTQWRKKLDMSKFIENIHLKLPDLFLNAGLKKIALNGYLSTFLLSDPRHKIEEMQEYVRAKLHLWQRLRKRNSECAIVGGMDNREFEELYEKHTAYLKGLVENPAKIKETAEVEIVSRVVVTGVK